LELNCKHYLLVSDDIDLLEENINIIWGRKTEDTEVGMTVTNKGYIHTEIKGKLNINKFVHIHTIRLVQLLCYSFQKSEHTKSFVGTNMWSYNRHCCVAFQCNPTVLIYRPHFHKDTSHYIHASALALRKAHLPLFWLLLQGGHTLHSIIILNPTSRHPLCYI
jgi:hypothetical protein